MKPKNKHQHGHGPSVKPVVKHPSNVLPDPAQAQPVAVPSPSMDGKRPIPEGTGELEKFLVATDTNGGE